MAAKPNKPNSPPPLAELAHQYRNLGEWASNTRTPLPMRIQTVTEAHNDVEFNPEQVNTSLSHGMDLETHDAVVYRMDRLVQDLLASRKSLKDEKRKAADKDAEIAQLKQDVAYHQNGAYERGQKHEAELRELEQMSMLNSANCEEVNELRRLLAFHKTNGEQVSRKLRDLQAINKDLEAQLQVTEMALHEQMSLLSGLGLCTQEGNSNPSKERAAAGGMKGAILD